MQLTDEIRIKSLDLQTRYGELVSEWHQHPLSRFEYKFITGAVTALVMGLLARNRTFRRLFLAYNLILRPNFN